MPSLGTLRNLDLDHLHLVLDRLLGKSVGIEVAIGGSAAEVATAKFPHEVAAVLAVVGTDASFAGVMEEVALLGTLVQGHDGVSAQCAPKLMAEMLYTDAEYGLEHSAPPTSTLNGSVDFSLGAIEWLSHSYSML